jgi:hypothetical protein
LAGNTSMSDVSCASPTACTAVGSYTVLRYDGSSWSTQQPAYPTVRLPPDSSYVLNGLTDVSCASRTACTAVGSYYVLSDIGYGGTGVHGPDLTLAESWNGSRWSIQPTPNPRGAAGSGLAAVSCRSRIACTAVGNYQGRSGRTRILVEHWNGNKWSTQPSSNPATATSITLTDVSCGSNLACTAIGSYRNHAGQTLTLVEHWTAGRWSAQPTPSPAGGPNAQLTRVSCASAKTCIAIGTYRRRILAERWDGRGWSIQPIPTPAGGANAELTGVSCASPATCTAVGSYKNDTGQHLTLVEHWTGTSK